MPYFYLTFLGPPNFFKVRSVFFCLLIPDINWDMDLTLIPSCVTSIKETLVIDSMLVLDLTQEIRSVYLDLLLVILPMKSPF
jgi:hypothetical protein